MVEKFSAYTKFMIIKHAMMHKDVTLTCALYGVSRTSFYKWLKAYRTSGMDGLEQAPSKPPKMPNKVGKAIEKEILFHVAEFPEDGPKRIYYALKSEGIHIGETGIFNVLKRHDLTKRKDRMEYAKDPRHKSKKRKSSPSSYAHLLDAREKSPGYLLLQRIDYIGNFDGVGRIYQHILFDAASRWAFVKLYGSKTEIDVWHYFEQKLVYLMKTFKLSIDTIITEKDTAYTPQYLKGRKLEQLTTQYGMMHHFIPDAHDELFSDLNQYYDELMNAFYEKQVALGHFNSLTSVERLLQGHLRQYNFFTRIKDGPYKGLTPAKVVLNKAVENHADLETLPLWLLAIIDASNKGDPHED